jgi:putative endonuclease
MKGTYVVYIVECADRTLYTGITTNLERRVAEHNSSSKGAKYTKARRPVRLIYSEPCVSRSVAQQREHVVRSLSHVEKKALSTA